MNKPKFVYVTYIETTAEKLWRALTEGEFTRQYWFGIDLKSDWKIGSPVVFSSSGGMNVSGKVLEYRPHTRLAYSWRVEFNEIFRKEEPSRVSFDLEPMGKDVKLVVTHDDFEPGSKVFESISNGWPIVLSSVKSLLETGHALAAERAFLGILDGSCRTPIAGLGVLAGDILHFRGLVLALDGSDVFEIAMSGPVRNAAAIGQAAGENILARMPPGFMKT